MPAHPLVAEPIFPAVQLPRRRPEAPTEGRAVTVAIGFYALAWLLGGGAFALSIAALLRHEWQCLPWFALGFFLALAGPGAITALCVRGMRPKASVPDSKVTEVLGFLRLEAPNDALAARLRSRRPAAWLSGDGVYLDSGEHFGWERFRRFRLVPRKADLLEIWFRVKHTQRQRWGLHLLTLASALLLLAAPVSEVVAAIHGLSLPAAAGVRDDVLAAAFAAVSMLVGCAGTACLTIGGVRGSGVASPTLILLIDARHSPRDRVHALLEEHVPEADPLS